MMWCWLTIEKDAIATENGMAEDKKDQVSILTVITDGKSSTYEL